MTGKVGMVHTLGQTGYPTLQGMRDGKNANVRTDRYIRHCMTGGVGRVHTLGQLVYPMHGRMGGKSAYVRAGRVSYAREKWGGTGAYAKADLVSHPA